MRMYDIIKKKRDGIELTKAEIEFLINGYVAGNIPEYQISAFLMAVYFKGMTDRETADLTLAMVNSGEIVDLSLFGNLSADKHSTGGVGDKTTLIVAPIAAALGVKTAKMSGRGLGHTGGTVDKLESINGYKTVLSPDAFLKQVESIGIAVISQSGNLTPADKLLYALRDVTATVDSIPLIASSVMSKKIASGAMNIVLDVKCGSGAFMKTASDAKKLAQKMVDIGTLCSRRVAAIITNMDVPLGNNIGNSLEVSEAVRVLKNEQKGDLRVVSVNLAAAMVSLGLNMDFDNALNLAEQALNSGKAYEKFKEWIKAQGGRCDFDNDFDINKAKYSFNIISSKFGYIGAMDAEKIGITACVLGAGRVKKEDKIDYTAGIVLAKKTGDYVKSGDVLATLYSNDLNRFESAVEIFNSALTFSDTKPILPNLIEKIIM